MYEIPFEWPRQSAFKSSEGECDRDSGVRVTPNSLCSGRKSAWAPELNTADWMVLTSVAAATIHHP